MRLANENDRERIIEYLSSDIDNCVYMYIDVKTYDICSENVKVWLQEDGEEIILAVMKYYDSFQVYSRKENVNISDVVDLIHEIKVSMVSAPRYLIERLEKECADYEVNYGAVYECEKIYENIDGLGVEWATGNDAEEIAAVICSDDEFAKNYNVDILAKQMRDRINLGLGRSCIIRIDNRIVAHAATFAETDDIAVLSGSIVLKEARQTDCYIRINNFLNTILTQEKKKIYAFAVNKRVRKMMDYSCRLCGEYGKLTRK